MAAAWQRSRQHPTDIDNGNDNTYGATIHDDETPQRSHFTPESKSLADISKRRRRVNSMTEKKLGCLLRQRSRRSRRRRVDKKEKGTRSVAVCRRCRNQRRPESALGRLGAPPRREDCTKEDASIPPYAIINMILRSALPCRIDASAVRWRLRPQQQRVYRPFSCLASKVRRRRCAAD